MRSESVFVTGFRKIHLITGWVNFFHKRHLQNLSTVVPGLYDHPLEQQKVV